MSPPTDNIIGRILAVVAPPKNDGFVGRTVVLPPTLQLVNKAQIITGEVVDELKNNVLRIKTPEGTIEVQVRGRDVPARGQQVQLEIPAGNPPRQVIVKPAPEQIAARPTQTPQTAPTSPGAPNQPVPNTGQQPVVPNQVVQTNNPQPTGSNQPIQNNSALPTNINADEIVREVLPQLARTAGRELPATIPDSKSLSPLERGTIVRLLPLTPVQTQQALQQIPLPQTVQTTLPQAVITRVSFEANLIVQSAQSNIASQVLTIAQDTTQPLLRTLSNPQTLQPPQPPQTLLQPSPQVPVTTQPTTAAPQIQATQTQQPVLPLLYTPLPTSTAPGPQTLIQLQPIQQLLAQTFLLPPAIQSPSQTIQQLQTVITLPPATASAPPSQTPSTPVIQSTLPPATATPLNIQIPAPANNSPLPVVQSAPTNTITIPNPFQTQGQATTPLQTNVTAQVPAQTSPGTVSNVSPQQNLQLDARIQSFTPPNVQIVTPANTPLQTYNAALTQIQSPAFQLLQGQANSITAQVVALTPQNLPIVVVQQPGNPLPQNFVLQTPAPNITVGSQIQLTPQTANILTQPSLPQAPVQSAPQSFTLFDLLRPGPWPALDQLYQASIQVSAQAAQALSGVTPTPTAATIQQMGPAALFFLSVLRSGDLSSWLGNKTIDALQRAGKGNVIQRMSQEVSSLNRGDTPVGEWRAVPLPLFYEGEMQRMTLYTKSDQDTDSPQDEKKQTRFIFDLDLTRMGPVQLDGLIRGQRLDLVVRTQAPFSEPMRQVMRQSYTKALEDMDLNGELNFQGDARHWVNVLPKDDTTLIETV